VNSTSETSYLFREEIMVSIPSNCRTHYRRETCHTYVQLGRLLSVFINTACTNSILFVTKKQDRQNWRKER